jgi:prophage regulatory protein
VSALNNLNSQHLLRLPEVKHLTGLSKSSIYARIAEDSFPRQIPLGSRTVVWLEPDIQNWIAEMFSAEREEFLLPARGRSTILIKKRDNFSGF